MSEATKRTILKVSFGILYYGNYSIAKSMVFQILTRFPDTLFLWKYENVTDSFSEELRKTRNVFSSDWFPQRDLLCESIE